MSRMRIVTLIENTVSKRDLIAEHGLSFFIEHNDASILFDTGQSNNFAHNAEILGVDIANIDFLILSHGHYDHTGGLAHFIENNEKAKILLKKQTLWPKFKNNNSIGMGKHINMKNPRFRMIEQITEIVNGVFIIPETKQFYPIDRHINDFYTQPKKEIIQDEFSDELFLVFKNNDGISILSSCSHNGITNMAETAKRQFKLPLINIIGGFHIKNANDSALDHISKYFNENVSDKVYTCHCTGIEKYNQLKLKCQYKVEYNETGNAIII